MERKIDEPVSDSANVKPPAQGLGTVPPDAEECIWMRAGVVTYKLCSRQHDCDTCSLYSALRGQPSGQAPLTASGTLAVSPDARCDFPGDRRYGSTHSWAHIPGPNLARVGLDSLAAWLLGEVKTLDFVREDTWVDRGDVMATVRCGTAKIKVRSPVPGRVLGHNRELEANPALLISDPYGKGWLADIGTMPSRGGAQLDKLLTGPEMARLASTDMERLQRRTAELAGAKPTEVGATMADGGERVKDLRILLGAKRYLELVKEMLA